MSKKFISILSVVLILTFIGSVFPPVSTKASVGEMTKDLNKGAALDEFEKTDNMQINLIGDSNAIKNYQKLDGKTKKLKDTDLISSEKEFNSIWITEEEHNKYLSKNGVKKLDKYLNKGYSIYFLGLKDLNILKELFTDVKSHEELKESQVGQQVAFLTRNMNGETFTGSILSDRSYTDERMLKTITASTWNRRNDFKYTKKKAEISFIDKVANKVYASNGSDFTIGSKWRSVFPWTQYTLDTIKGTQTEWKAAFYLTDPKDGQNYYAMAIEAAMDPDSGISSRELNYYSDANSNGQANQLRQYNPKANPTSSTISFNVGGSYSQAGGTTGSIGASWNVVLNDLTITDSSSPSSQIMNLYFRYSVGSSYAKQTTWQNVAFVYLAPSGSSNCIIDNKRAVIFRDGNAPDGANSHYMTTTVYK